MKGTLIKRSEKHYDLYTDKGLYTSNYQWTKQGNLLSGKNCQAIENRYDLEELVDEEYQKFDLDARIVYRRQLQESLTSMFQKAMKLMEGKKYSDEDMLSAYRKGELSRYSSVGEAVLESIFIQSLQTKEWDVEIVTKPYPEVGEGFELESKREPKLDSDGCLILKRL